jgi:hypothetical protein
MILRPVRRLLVLLSAVAVGLLVTAAPVAAAPPTGPVTQAFADCPAGYGCFWNYTNGGGFRWEAPSCGIWRLGGSALDNFFDSVRNRGGGTVHLYDAPDAVNGYLMSVRNNGVGVNLPTNYRNKVSSLRIDC